MSRFRVRSTPGSENLTVLDSQGNTHTVETSQIVIGPLLLVEPTVETKADNYTVDAEDMGKCLCIATDAKAFTLPAMAAGYAGFEVTFKNTGADGAVALNISPNSSDKIMGPDWAGEDDKDAINTKATAKYGDFMTLRGDGTNGWWIVAKRGIWAAES